jgi:hypothetical protein
MLNPSATTRAVVHDFEVTMHRKACLNANEAARKCIVFVRATDVGEAKKAADRLPHKRAFMAMSARQVK